MKRFRARDGTMLAYRDEGVGPAMLLLHGLNAHGGFFARQAGGLPGRRLVAPDFRGHGGSPPRADADIALLARDVEDLIAHLALDQVVGVGWSLGAMVLWAAATGPAAPSIAACVSIDMSPRLRNGDGWSLGLIAPAMRAPPPDEAPAARGRRIAELVVAGDAPDRDALVDWMAPRFAIADRPTVDALNASLLAADDRERLRRMTAPVLAIGGAASRFYAPATQDFIAASARSGRAVIVPDAGHAPHLEQPATVNALLAAL